MVEVISMIKQLNTDCFNVTFKYINSKKKSTYFCVKCVCTSVVGVLYFLCGILHFVFYCIGVLTILQDFRHRRKMDLSNGGHALHIHPVKYVFRPFIAALNSRAGMGSVELHTQKQIRQCAALYFVIRRLLQGMHLR